MDLKTFVERSLSYFPNNLKLILTHHNYKKILRKLKKEFGKRKLRVCFLNSENSKWVYGSLYDKLIKSKFFTPVVLLVVDKDYSDRDIEKLKTNYEFFNSRGMNVEYAFDIETKEHIPLSEFNPDIIFYQEPWTLPRIQQPRHTSKYSLCCYCSYGTGTTNGRNEYCSRFFKEVWAYFLDNNFVKKVLTNHGVNGKNLVVTGSIKLDAYSYPLNPDKQIWQTNNFRIIYAPHFSFAKDSILKFGTFDIYYKFFVEFAKSHPEIEFIFKPHPVLRKMIVQEHLMTEAETDDYYAFWANSNNTHFYDKGDYFDIFKTSDMMITDCNSFLTEYLPAQKPLIQLIAGKSIGLNEFGEEITKGYYKVHNLEELKAALNKLIIQKDDTLKEERKKCMEKLIMPQIGTAGVIMNYLIEKIKNGGD